ncbi:uncharacterized protein [Solanum lycopersicum]|uniref:Uncharacterized protein n=1 Tax=Solanum lycopersicum TaxID=4081 RepID=K4CXI8_SOLLC|nr:uncharacterized protein LOC101251519 [Solanum lycopersicum]
MKFFVELVSCCGCSLKRSHRTEEEEEEEILVPTASVASSDINTIITYKRRRRRRRGSARSVGSFPQWKPSLYSISEDADHVLPPRMVAADSGTNLKRKTATIASRPVNQLPHNRNRKSRFSRIACLAAMIPAPFLI